MPFDTSLPKSTYDSANGKIMFYASANAIFQALGDDACLLVPVPNAPEKSTDVFMAISKERKRLRRNINRLLLKMGNAGLIKRIRDQWVDQPDLMCEKSAGFEAIAFGDMLSVLLIIPLTMCACVVMFGLEWFLFKLTIQIMVNSRNR